MTMDLKISCDEVTSSLVQERGGGYGTHMSVSLSGVDEDTMMEEIADDVDTEKAFDLIRDRLGEKHIVEESDYEKLLEHMDKDDIADFIGAEYCKKHFGLTEEE